MNDFRMFIVKAITLVFVTLILTLGSCCMHIDYRISKAIEGGSDPVIARLAFETDGGYIERILYIADKEK